MTTNSSGQKNVAPAPRKKGGRPKKNSARASPGNEVEKAIVSPDSKRDYRVTSRGEVYRILKDGRKQRVKPWFSGPYECVYIYGVSGVTNKYGRKKCYVHKLVKDHFSSEKKTASKPFIHHVNGDERDNSISNLKYTNMQDNLKARKFFYKNDDGKILRKKRVRKPQQKKDIKDK